MRIARLFIDEVIPALVEADPKMKHKVGPHHGKPNGMETTQVHHHRQLNDMLQVTKRQNETKGKVVSS